ncbi:glycosyltransferase [Superficieibacter sp.]|uniref:glycosyltransferase n=1 Tax=Superficieibacter sp. TaxID=2303322 RepID=UPI0028A8249A|nr:glycosyltransferase [Superficieibacter sp.]
MKSNNKISVLMSVYNEKDEWVIKAVNSILTQDYENYELIIIIDNPNRDISHIKVAVERHNNVLIKINEKNIGLADSLNRAASMANGSYLARMDADDISLPGRLKCQFDYLQKYDYDMVGGAIELINDQEEPISFSRLPSDLSLLKKLVKYRTICFHPTWLLKREVYDLINGYRAFPAAQDLDFILRALDKGVKISNVSDVVLKYRINDNSISVKKSLIQRRCQRFAHKLSKKRFNNNGVDGFTNKSMMKAIRVSRTLEYLHNISNRLIKKSSFLRKKGNGILASIYLFLSIIISYEQFIFVYKAVASKVILRLNSNNS